jgi:DNA repair photolyase
MRLIKLIKQKRKTPILKSPAFGCLKNTPSINITRGCSHSCVYCYARGFTDSPPKGEVHLYENLPEKLEEELARKKRLPPWVSFSTASDAFQAIDEILETTYHVMKILLERGIGVSFLTKGLIPYDFIRLFERYKKHVKARIGIVSISCEYTKLFEPFSASPTKRLSLIEDLLKVGIDTAVRVDPIIPPHPPLLKGNRGGFSEESLEKLIKRLRVVGVEKISISALVMRPSLTEQFLSELPFGLAKEILRHYSGQPWQRVITSAKTKLLPKAMRIELYRRVRDLANQYRIDSSVCGCKNPDLPWESCNPWIEENDLDLRARQGNLFATSI